MSKSRTITCRVSEYVCEQIQRIMDERNIDRSTVIKLALYVLDSYMSRRDVQQMDLFAIIADLEKSASSTQPKFAQFSWLQSPGKREQA